MGMENDNLSNKVLFVDDEKKIHQVIQKELKKAQLDLFFVQNGEDGLRLLERECMDLVVSDFQMPEMNGIDFLSAVKLEYQDVNRMLLSNELDQPDVNLAITRGYATSFLTKPWAKDVLRNSIEHVLEVRDILKSKKLLETIHEIDRLPCLPDVYQEFIEAVFKEQSAGEIASVIEKDVSITTRLLQVANSAFYGSVGICSVDRSIVRLGLNAVKDMVLTLSFVNELDWSGSQLKRLEDIFNHSSMVNKYFKKVYRIKNGVPLPPEVASIGLTHDIGNIIILQYFPERFESTIRNQERHPGMTFYESERDLGYRWFMHEEIGAYFLHMWNLPDVMVEAALFHHRPERASAPLREIMRAMNFADILVSQLELKPEEENIDPICFESEYLPADVVEDVAAEITQELFKPAKLPI